MRKIAPEPDLADADFARDTRALARAATLIESQAEGGRKLISSLFARTGRAILIGITGPPGAGKSTLVDQLIRHFRARARKVGVIAVDPSSPYTNGAILGDRIRLGDHFGDPGVFIRSMATRGKLGGLARSTVELSLLLDAAGFDTILIETVGVGQDEVDIAGVADVTVVVLVPGLGDDVQAIKAGIIEIADVLVVNKADLPGADRLEEELRAMQSLTNTSQPAPIVRVIASEGSGVDQLLEQVDGISKRRKTGADRIGIWSARLLEMLRESVLSDVSPAELNTHAAKVAAREEDPYQALAQLRASLLKRAQMSVEVDHLGIAVRSLAEGLQFYEKTLGMSVSLRQTVESESVHVAMLPAGSSAGAPRIELLEATHEASTIAKFVGSRGPGLHHVALRVDDLEAAVDRLTTGGYRVLHEPRIGAGGHKYVFVHPQSTGGVLLELIQK